MKIVLNRMEFLNTRANEVPTHNILPITDFVNENELKAVAIKQLSDNERVKKIEEFPNQ